MKRNANLVMRDIEKVRHHVMGIIYHSEGRREKLASLRDLAAHFGLAVSTVKIAFDKLEQEGYITSHHGVGSFTNPRQAFFSGQRPLPLIGVKIGHGDEFYYDIYILKGLAELTAQCALFPCNLRLLTAGCATPEEFEVELRNSHIDALLTWQVDPKLPAAGAKLFPTVNIGERCAGIPSVTFSKDEAARELGDRLCRSFAEPVVMQLHDHHSVHGFGEALHNDLRLRHIWKCRAESQTPDWLEKEIAAVRPDCVITSAVNAELIRDLLDRNGRKDAELVLPGDGFYLDAPSCYHLAASRREEVSTALGWLRKMLRGDKIDAPEHRMEIQLLRHQQQSLP